MKRFALIALISIAAAGMLAFSRPGLAADALDQLGTLTQAEFRDLSEDLSSAFSYKGVVPAEPLGWTGFDVSTGLLDEEIEQSKLYFGLNVKRGLFNFAFEADTTGGAETLSAKVGARF